MPNGPTLPDQPEKRGVKVKRDSIGRWQFRDLKTGQQISRESGIRRLSVDPESNQIVDSLGNTVGPGALSMRKSGIMREFRNGIQRFSKLTVPLSQHEIGENQAYVERLTIRTVEGNIEQRFITHGKGKAFSIDAGSREAAAWGGALREAAGLDRGVDITTTKLKEFIVRREIVISTTTYK